MSNINTPNTFNKYGNFVASKDAFFTKDARNDNSEGLIYRASNDLTQRDIILIENDDKALYSISLNDLPKSDPNSSLSFYTYDDDGNKNPIPAIEIKRNTNETKIADLDITSVTAPTINCTDLNVTGTATINNIDISTTDITCTDINVTGTTQSTSIDTGAIITDGGVGIAKTVYIGEDLNIGQDLTTVGDITAENITAATLGSFASIECNTLESNSTTQSTSVGTGAIVTAGGIGVAKDIRSGGDIYGTDIYFTRLIQGADDTGLSDVALELESNMVNGEIKRFTIGKNTTNNGDNFIFAYKYSNTENNRECRLGLFGFPAMKFQTTQTLFEGLPVQVNDDFSVTGSQTTSVSTPSLGGNTTLNSSSKYIQFISADVNINLNLPDPLTNPGLMFRIYNNSGAAQTIDIKSGGVSVGSALTPGQVAELVSLGPEWVRSTNTFTT